MVTGIIRYSSIWLLLGLSKKIELHDSNHLKAVKNRTDEDVFSIIVQIQLL